MIYNNPQIMPRFNDINLDKWKDSNIWTDSLWIIQERDKPFLIMMYK